MNCPKNLKRCGSLIDDRFFCVIQSIPCPIVDMGFIVKKNGGN